MLSIAVLHDPQQRCWHRYRNPDTVLHTWDHNEVEATLAEVHTQVEQQQLFAVGFVCYGAAAGFDAALPSQPPGLLPLVCFALYKSRESFNCLSAINGLGDDAATQLGEWRMAAAPAQYMQAVEKLRKNIGEGATYQVNYTTRLSTSGCLDFSTFRRMAEGAPYAAYFEGDAFAVASASPELFFELREGVVTSRPMKGTVARGLDSTSDRQAATWLAQSQKNRAENLMITDMVRNDLGRIAEPGSVQVQQLFDVEQYPTVWQMTSTVTAQTRHNVVEVFRALFPGASITGAPKKAAMEFINQLEASPRDIYTGSMGVIEPGGTARFNIAIRTAWTDKPKGVTHYAAGGGIVWDSQAADEYAELVAKTQVLYGSSECFELFETMLWQPATGIYLRDRHLERLAASARYFRFEYSAKKVAECLAELDRCEETSPRRLRLVLAPDGTCELEVTPMPTPNNLSATQAMMFAHNAVDQNDRFLYHKTTIRDRYAQAAAEVPAGVEALLFNQQGHVTESTIANVVYQMDGTLYTPPIADGLLPGTLRDLLVESGEVKERSLPVHEAGKVQAWFLINALRGWRKAELHEEESRVQDLLFS